MRFIYTVDNCMLIIVLYKQISAPINARNGLDIMYNYPGRDGGEDLCINVRL